MAVVRQIEKNEEQEKQPRDVNLPARLSASDSALLVNVVESQNQPNEQLKRAAQRFRQRHS